MIRASFYHEERNIAQYSSDVEETDVEIVLDEKFCDPLQAQEVDRNVTNAAQAAVDYRSTWSDMRAPQKDERGMYGKIPQEHRQCSIQQAVRREHLYQAQNSVQGANVRDYQHHGNGRVRREGFSHQPTSSPGYSEKERNAVPLQYQWHRNYQQTNSPEYSYQEANARANQRQGNGRVRRPGFTYQGVNALCYQQQGVGWISRPGYSYQQASSPEYSEHGANDPAYNHQRNSRPYVHSYQQTSNRGYPYLQANACGYSYNQANDRHQHQKQRQEQDPIKVNRTSRQSIRISVDVRQQSTQRSEIGSQRRKMQWSNGEARLLQIQQSTEIHQHSQTRSRVAVRRCGRQEVCKEANQYPEKRNGVCNETDSTQKERVFLRVLSKRF